MRRSFFAIILLLLPLVCGGQSNADINSAALTILGISSIEDLETDIDLSQFENHAQHPLNLNKASRRELLESGLFTSFQAAALLDHRERLGEIYSWTQLQTIAGFSTEFVDALKCFTCLETFHSADWREDARPRARNNLQGKLAYNSGSTTYALRDNFSYGNNSALIAIKSAQVKAALALGNERMRLIAGDYYVRFGQGLVQDMGTMMTNYHSPSSLAKKTSCIRPGSSYSCYGAARGVALTYNDRKSDYNIYWDGAGEQMGFYSQYTSFRWGLGAIANYKLSEKRLDLSLEARRTWGPLMCYTETGWACNELATITGLRYRLFDHITMGMRAKYSTPNVHFLPSELELAYACEYAGKIWTLTSSVSYIKNAKKTQLDAYILSKVTLPLNLKWNTAMQLRTRGDPYSKFLLKSDLRYSLDKFSMSIFAQGCHVDENGFLAGCEAGFQTLKGGCYLKYAYWKALLWNDRVYLYLRSSPGSFNIPALYKEGMLLSGYGTLDVGKRLKIYLTLYGIVYRASLHKEPRVHSQIETRYRF